MKEVDVVNMALLLLGQPRVTDEQYKSQASEPSVSGKMFFPLAVKKMLRKHPWSFALRRERVCSCPHGGDFRADLPDSCVRLMFPYAGGYQVSVFSIRGREIVSPEKVDEIEYVDGDVDIDCWDPMFVECVALDLAAKLAGPVCQSPNLEAAMIQKLNQVEFPDAVTQDAREVCSAENNPTMRNLSKSLLLRARL